MFTIKTHRRNPMAMNITFMTSSRFGILGFAHGALGVVRQNMKKIDSSFTRNASHKNWYRSAFLFLKVFLRRIFFPHIYKVVLAPS